ncbi:aminotransferase class I/II-fold pyridoxal phosphate-dependent enzyme [Pullulanibacillus sp. KACC 23026]|uniref:DegT/DnrJ/EryC1/StrS family aminotransferase n=1 Tax=Pullulanibacillus sp. KACC 23026 TaxID=3028315 RepID=UPI0023B0E55C|nr:aminotransferase class I/II-fold pyridoxal phosphate-dependent enzyme [Pullulanibacillus sp. KACC 23026]WEG11512.1 aminotransferase class I/II-fold pyridoxal phosphate-dependent enzyme [Pullulanibacillus sp. KACC 23026]
MNNQRIYLSPPHLSGEEELYIREAFESNWIAPLGPHVNAFEEELANYAGIRGAVAVSSGTAAIHLALCLLGVKKGDRVFCSTLTFVASANPILYQGAEPVFIDSEPDSWNMSPKALEQALMEAVKEGQLPKAVIVVNLYGQTAKMDEISALCEFYRIPIIEDAAESLGSTYRGKKSGSFGHFGVFSFNGNKIITTSGGGALISNDDESLSRARFLATQARDPAPHYQHSQMGYNYRLSNLLAGVGRAQLKVLEDRIEARRAIFRRYEEALVNVPGLRMMPELEQSYSNRWLTTLTINEREAGFSVKEVLSALDKENIEARPVWKPLHLQPLFLKNAFYSHNRGKPISDSLFYQGICLPSGSSLTPEEQARVIQCIYEVYKKAGSSLLMP